MCSDISDMSDISCCMDYNLLKTEERGICVMTRKVTN